MQLAEPRGVRAGRSRGQEPRALELRRGVLGALLGERQTRSEASCGVVVVQARSTPAMPLRRVGTLLRSPPYEKALCGFGEQVHRLDAPSRVTNAERCILACAAAPLPWRSAPRFDSSSRHEGGGGPASVGASTLSVGSMSGSPAANTISRKSNDTIASKRSARPAGACSPRNEARSLEFATYLVSQGTMAAHPARSPTGAWSATAIATPPSAGMSNKCRSTSPELSGTRRSGRARTGWFGCSASPRSWAETPNDRGDIRLNPADEERRRDPVQQEQQPRHHHRAPARAAASSAATLASSTPGCRSLIAFPRERSCLAVPTESPRSRDPGRPGGHAVSAVKSLAAITEVELLPGSAGSRDGGSCTPACARPGAEVPRESPGPLPCTSRRFPMAEAALVILAVRFRATSCTCKAGNTKPNAAAGIASTRPSAGMEPRRGEAHLG